MELNIKEYSDASLSYIMFQRQGLLINRDKSFKKTLKLTELKLLLTNKLISLNKPQILHMGSEELRVLNRQQIFSNILKNGIVKLYEWKNASPEEKKRIWKKVRKYCLSQQQAKCAKVERESGENENSEENMQSYKKRKIDDEEK